VIWAGIFAAGIGAGAVLIARAIWPPSRPLSVLAIEVRQPRSAIDPRGPSGSVRGWWRSVARRLSVGTSARLAADLAVLGRTPVRHQLDKLGYALTFALIGIVPAVVLALVDVDADVLYPVLGVLLLAALGYVYPDLEVRSKAVAARRSWAHALTVYVDIVAISLAGGAGVDDALLDASTAGRGREFDALAGALRAAQTRRRTLWDALDELGARLDLRQLRELAASIELAGETGSRIRETLLAKATAMRHRQLSDIEADAQRATETMGIAPALMALAAVLLIGYPAVARFLGT
jgi:Flp pilus assembly protein TadB